MSGSQSAEILLVEDTASDAELALIALRQCAPGHRIVWVKDGQEALDYVHRMGTHAQRQEGPPRMILLDLKLPRVDGIGVVRSLKADAATKDIPIVMFTSSAEDCDVNEAYRLGVNSYLVKPVDAVIYVETVTRAVHYWMQLNRIASGP